MKSVKWQYKNIILNRKIHESSRDLVMAQNAALKDQRLSLKLVKELPMLASVKKNPRQDIQLK